MDMQRQIYNPVSGQWEIDKDQRPLAKVLADKDRHVIKQVVGIAAVIGLAVVVIKQGVKQKK